MGGQGSGKAVRCSPYSTSAGDNSRMIYRNSLDVQLRKPMPKIVVFAASEIFPSARLQEAVGPDAEVRGMYMPV